MDRKRKVPLAIAILALTGGIAWLGDRIINTRQGPVLKSALAARHETPTPDDTMVGPVTIDFALLDQARPLDLIDMDLDFPESLRALDGKRVKIIGFMAPFDSLNDMRRCMIVPSYVGCTFCSPPSLTQVLYIEQSGPPGTQFTFIEEPSDVSGTLRLPGSDGGHPAHRQGFVFVLDDAVATPYVASDAPTRAPGHGLANGDPSAPGTPHTIPAAAVQGPVSPTDLVTEVSALRGLAPIQPIEFVSVSIETITKLTRAECEARFPIPTRPFQAKAFALLGLINPSDDWGETLMGLTLSQRITATSPEGTRISYLETAPLSDPYVRLELVKEIADALARQHFESARQCRADDEDATRALEAIRQGHRQIVAYRYARKTGLSPGSRPPEGLLPDISGYPAAPVDLDLWHWLPWEAGPFFIDSRAGSTGPLTGIDAVFRKPPRSTVEIFRPRWYDDVGLWQRSIVPVDFADSLIDTVPEHSDVLGLGGLVPWMASTYPVDVCKQLCGNWAGDRYALWTRTSGGDAILLETHWQTPEAARQFQEGLPDHPLQYIQPALEGSTRVRVVRAEADAALQDLASALRRKQ